MRTIRFRGKDFKTGEWITGDLRQRLGYYPSIIESYCGDNGKIAYREVCVKSETVGQFTGLYDKNGKEIYEGDIIRTEGNDITYEIIYNEKSAAFIGIRISRVFNLLDLYEIDTVSREIIGNIHDNLINK